MQLQHLSHVRLLGPLILDALKLLISLGLCCRGQQEAPPERAPYKPEGAPWRAALSEHAASNSTVGGLTGAALLKEWQQLQETAKKPRWCAAHPPGLTTRRRGPEPHCAASLMRLCFHRLHATQCTGAVLKPLLRRSTQRLSSVGAASRGM